MAVSSFKRTSVPEHQPANTTEELLANEMAEQFWRLGRARAMEASLLDSDQVLIPQLAAIQRMMSSAERGFHKALAIVRQMQKDRGSRSEPASALGFVPTNSPLAEPRPEGASGSVPPPCPAGEDIGPADWARAFVTRHKIWKKQEAA